MKTITQKCYMCGILFEMKMKYYNRNQKNNIKSCCSRKCTQKFGRQVLHDNPSLMINNRYNISQHSDNAHDKYSPFRTFLKTSITRSSHKQSVCDLDLEYLYTLWNEQKQTCPYTGITMILPKSTLAYCKIKSLRKASLDRIDSSKGYIKGNVEFVTLFINLAKNTYSRKDVMSIISDMKMVAPLGIEPSSPL